MTEPTIRVPNADSSEQELEQKTQPTVNAVENLVTRGGYEGNPREIVQNPAVTPEMLDDQQDLRVDFTDDN
jgi:hypothetical protein